jgi:DNA replication and repair protein RecF
MRLLWVSLRDFRNHADTELQVPPGIVALVGPNAQGKTNALEAVHYLMTLSSPRTSSDQPLIREGATSAFVRGEVDTEGGRVLVEVEIKPSGANRVQVNKSNVRRKRDVRGRVRSVLFLPEDLAIIQGEPDERRRFMDEAVASLWPRRDGERRAYDKALRQRNRLLKEHEGVPASLEAWDEELISSGVPLVVGRRDAVGRLAGPAGDAYQAISGERLQVRYAPSVDPDDPEASFRELLASRRDDELIRRTTLVGPHRDELQLAVGERTARRFASHGESWAAALCLRLGLARALELEMGEQPVLLLDDPFSGVDPQRRRRLTAELEGRGQTMLAVPDDLHVPPGATAWRVGAGRVSRPDA